MSTYSILWLLWLALFLPIEVRGLKSKTHGATLSAHCWRWFCFHEGAWTRPYWRIRRATFITFWTALTLHFIAGLPAWPYLVASAVPFVAVILLSSWKERQ
jgi:hypothetical protein